MKENVSGCFFSEHSIYTKVLQRKATDGKDNVEMSSAQSQPASEATKRKVGVTRARPMIKYIHTC